MVEDELTYFPDQSMNDAGEIVDLQLWVDEFEKYFDERIVGEIRITIEVGLQFHYHRYLKQNNDFEGRK